RASAGKRYPSASESRKQRSKHQTRSPHGFDQIVRSFCVANFTRANVDFPTFDYYLRSDVADQIEHSSDIPHFWDAVQRNAIRSEKTGRDRRQCGILRAADSNFPCEWNAAFDCEFIQRVSEPPGFAHGHAPTNARLAAAQYPSFP